MSTPASITKLLAWCEANLSTLVYSESDSRRLSNVLTDPTDCSGLARRMYFVFAGIEIGTYTGNEDDHGWEITATKAIAERGENMLPGDLIFYRWENRSLGGDPWDHVNIFAGDDLVYNHGGPGKGPVRQSLRANVNDAVAIMVRRIIAPVTPPIVVKPTPKPTTPPIPAPIEEFTVAQFDEIMAALAKIESEMTALKNDVDGQTSKLAHGVPGGFQNSLDAIAEKVGVVQAPKPA